MLNQTKNNVTTKNKLQVFQKLQQSYPGLRFGDKVFELKV